MHIFSVSSFRTNQSTDTRASYSSSVPDLWPPSVAAITFVFTMPDPSSDRLIVYAIDSGEDARGLYSIEGPRAGLPDLAAALAKRTSERLSSVVTVIGPGPVPPHPAGLPPGFQITAAPGSHHVTVAVAALSSKVITAIESLG